MITFDKAKPNELKDEVCMNGIETRRCHQQAVWFELENGWWVIAVLCDKCKNEVESYVLNQAIMAYQRRKPNATEIHAHPVA